MKFLIRILFDATHRNSLHNDWSFHVCFVLVFVLKMSQLIFMISVLTDVEVKIYAKICGKLMHNLQALVLLVLVLAPGEVHQLRFAGLEEALQLKRLRWSTNSK